MSQDDIDALVSTMTAAGDAKEKTEDTMRRAQPIIEKALDSMAAILSAFIGKQCELLSFETVAAAKGELGAILAPEDMAFKTSTFVKSEHPFFISSEQSALRKSANLMVGGNENDGLDEPLGEMRKSAVIEIISKVMGGVNDVFKGAQTRDDEGAITEVQAIEENPAAQIEGAIGDAFYLTTATFKINARDTWNFYLVFDNAFVIELAETAPSAPAAEPRPHVETAQAPKSAPAAPPPPPQYPPQYAQRPQYAPPPPQFAPPEPTVTYQPAQFQDLPRKKMAYEARNIEVLLDVPLQITVVLGRSKVPIKQVLEYGQGSLITLDKLAGEPVDLVINGKYFAKGEVVVIDENFGVRISSILTPEERMQQLTAVQPD
jgi:flagellar motor switch protein FliN/FliY